MHMMEMEMDYAKAWVGTKLGLDRDLTDNDDGYTMEQIVLMSLAGLGALAIGAVLWAKLKAGANNVTVPPPAAP
jgi:hypothetical protein